MPETDDTAMTATHCSLFVLSKAEELDRAFCYRDLNGLFTYGTLRNVICSLRRDGKILKFPKENPARFILTKWKMRPEYMKVFQNYRDPIGVGLTKRMKQWDDFFGFVESLGWGELAYLHNIRLEFNVFRVCGVCPGDGWCWCGRSHSYRKRFNCFEFPLMVQLYDSQRVQVAVRCSMTPVPFNFAGLTRLTSVLGELKGKLGWVDAPSVADWIVSSWHYGKDSVKEVSGPFFNVTFETWSKTYARIYVKSELKKVRAEEIQSPKRTIQELLETVLNQDPRMSEKQKRDWERMNENFERKRFTSLIRQIARDEVYAVLDEHLADFQHEEGPWHNLRKSKSYLRDFQKEGMILETARELSPPDEKLPVKPLSGSIKGGEHKRHRLSTGEILSRCLRLSKQLLERTGTEEEC